MQADKHIDLHTHSVFSDGKLTPTELVARAVEKNLTALALTDHDSLDGFGELKEAADVVGLEVITGVEMSCEFRGGDVHILGYGVDSEDAELGEMLKEFRDTRERRGVLIMEKLREIGIDLDTDAVLASAGDGALGRPHIAEALIEGGHVSNFSEAFNRYIGEDCPAYVDKFKMSPTDAVNRIHNSGGLAFVAHPGYYLEDLDAFSELLSEGFDGIEVLHPHHNAATVDQLKHIASQRNLMISGGSDFHGIAGRDNLGDMAVPYTLLENIKERLAAR